MSDAESVKKAYDRSAHDNYHLSQFDEPKRSTVHLARFVTDVLGADASAQQRVLDAACGAGAVIGYLADVLPAASWVGVDSSARVLELGRRRLRALHADLVEGDIFRLVDQFGAASFDVVLSVQTLSWLPSYEDALAEMLQCSRRWVFVTSLFSDTDLDAYVRLVDRRPSRTEDVDSNYNVYSFPRFRSVCEELGASQVLSRDFEIDVDIPRPPRSEFGTYTVATAASGRLQFSGPLLMPWKFVAIDLGEH